MKELKFIKDNENIILYTFSDFSVPETLLCGQCFRFYELSETKFALIAFGKFLILEEFDNPINYELNNTENKSILENAEKIVVFYNTTEEDFTNIWCNYFDFYTDYGKIKNIIQENDNIMRDAVSFASGIRILNQDFFECLISFIVSQNNRIPMIKKAVDNISKKYGKFICTYNGADFYSFPDVSELSKATEEELMECKVGFRAKYILSAVSFVLENPDEFIKMKELPTENLREKLISIKGVGPKVSDCVMLFSCQKHDVFPTDVWVKRVMSYFYFDNTEVSIKQIHKKAYDSFNEYAGYAQQYLFYYARSLKIGAKK